MLSNRMNRMSQSQGFPDGGYYVMRDGWNAQSNYLLFDCGPHGTDNCGHAHADALAIEVAANGQPLLIDPGTSLTPVRKNCAIGFVVRCAQYVASRWPAFVSFRRSIFMEDDGELRSGLVDQRETL